MKIMYKQQNICGVCKTPLTSSAQDRLCHETHEGDQDWTFGERLADKIASFGGSWWFLISFGIFLATWMSINSFAYWGTPHDPYPYIFLNLILSCIAAIQAPVIMMSQNRQEAKDRVRAEHDYQINLKAELEIRDLHEKIIQMQMMQQQLFALLSKQSTTLKESSFDMLSTAD